jgi:hypothetical protein
VVSEMAYFCIASRFRYYIVRRRGARSARNMSGTYTDELRRAERERRAEGRIANERLREAARERPSRERRVGERDSGREGRSEDFFARRVRERDQARRFKARGEVLAVKALGEEEYHRAGVKTARKRIAAVERKMARARADPAFAERHGSAGWLRINELATPESQLAWHLSWLAENQKERRRAQLRVARQAYEVRHPERQNRFNDLQERE